MFWDLAADTWGEEERAAINRVMDSGRYTIGPEVEAFEREKLHQPDGIFVGRPARIGRNAPARADRPVAVDQREDQIGVTGIDREQHRFIPQIRNTSPA